MKKVLWVVLAALLLVSCGKAVTAEPEKPLELTAKNIAGKWVLEGDSSVWYEFKADGTYNSNKENNKQYSLDKTKQEISIYEYDADAEKYVNAVRQIIVYKTHLLLSNKKYVKQ